MTDLLRAYTFPGKYAKELPIDSIVSDNKVDDNWVNEMVQSMEDPSTMKPIVVIKHPKREIYAVLDGHHRFMAIKRTGASSVRGAVVDDYIGLGFHLTSKGTFQPQPEFTRYVRVPLKRFASFMERFLKDPEGVLRNQLGR
jgi:hypothetical protein